MATKTSTVKRHSRKTSSGTTTVTAHKRTSYKPSGRFGAYAVYTTDPRNGGIKFRVYPNYKEDPIMWSESEPDDKEATTIAEATELNDPNSATFKAKMEECEADDATRNWKPTAGMKMVGAA